MTAVVLGEIRGKAGLIRIDRPEAMNASNDAVVQRIASAVDAFEADESIGCLVLTGNEKAMMIEEAVKEDQEEGMAAFAEKPRPSFKNR